MKVSITIPAHNEAKRIGRTLRTYHEYFNNLQQDGVLHYELLVVLNGCTDNTLQVVTRIQQELDNIVIVDLKEAGKGIAVKAGFTDALNRDNDLIGFVDADMATAPQYFYDLVKNIGESDAIIASRYMPGAQVTPARPKIKRLGSKIFFESLVKLLLGISHEDYQCGAKLFKRNVIKTIGPELTIRQWAFDIELLYLCKKHGFTVKEIPTVWFDQDDSKLKMSAGFKMLGSVVKLWWHHR